jgi:hypothetical protein
MIDMALVRGPRPAYHFTHWKRRVKNSPVWECLMEFGMFQLWVSVDI